MSRSRRLSRTVPAVAAAAVLAVGSTTSVAASPAAAPKPCGAHTVLTAVAMANDRVGWTAGIRQTGDSSVAVLRRFDHGTWSPVDIPLPTGSSSLEGLSVRSATAAVAVGQHNGGTPTDPKWQPMALAWNGARWTQLSMQGAPAHAELYGVQAFASNDIWAAGLSGVASLNPMVMHWDGSSWTAHTFTVHAPGWFNALSGSGDNDLWAVGTIGIQQFAEHWDGHAWTRIDKPTSWGSVLNGVTTFSNGNTEAVGWSGIGDHPSKRHRALVQSWDGQRWTRGNPAQPSGGLGTFYGLGAAGPDDLWAVGIQKTPANQQLALAEHWDGTSWTITPLPKTRGDSQLFGVATVSDHDAWAVGVRGLSTVRGCLLEHWDGATWTLR